MRKGSIFLVLATLILALSGCGVDNVREGNDKVQTNQVRINNVNNTDAQTLRISERAARQVEKLAEIDDAHVIISNNNAYVAVRSNNDTNTGIRKGNTKTQGRNGSATGYGLGNGAGTTGNGSDGATRFGTDKNGIIDGNENETNNNGITGTFTETSTPFEQKIADQVRKVDKNVHNIYISFNPDFYDTMGTYANDIKSGRNRDDLINNFNTTVRGIFGR